MFFFKVILTISFVFSLVDAQVIKNKLKYKYIEIEECSIPIRKESELLKKESQFEYSFFRPSPYFLKGIQVFKKEKRTYKELLEIIKKVPDLKLFNEEKQQHFSIITYGFKNNKFNDKHYYLIGEKSTIMMNEFDKAEVNYLIDYCESTWKFKETKNPNFIKLLDKRNDSH